MQPTAHASGRGGGDGDGNAPSTWAALLARYSPQVPPRVTPPREISGEVPLRHQHAHRWGQQPAAHRTWKSIMLDVDASGGIRWTPGVGGRGISGRTWRSPTPAVAGDAGGAPDLRPGWQRPPAVNNAAHGASAQEAAYRAFRGRKGWRWRAFIRSVRTCGPVLPWRSA